MNIKGLVSVICKNKQNVIKLNGEILKKYKTEFYSQKLPVWKIDLLWEFIWEDISLEEVKRIFRIGE